MILKTDSPPEKALGFRNKAWVFRIGRKRGCGGNFAAGLKS